MSELEDAVERVRERGQVADDPRLLLAGTLLTVEDIEQEMEGAVDLVIMAIEYLGMTREQGNPSPERSAAGTAWIDGLLIGLALADMRREAATQEGSL